MYLYKGVCPKLSAYTSPPELDQSDYVVGDHYTMRNKSLKNV